MFYVCEVPVWAFFSGLSVVDKFVRYSTYEEKKNLVHQSLFVVISCIGKR